MVMLSEIIVARCLSDEISCKAMVLQKRQVGSAHSWKFVSFGYVPALQMHTIMQVTCQMPGLWMSGASGMVSTMQLSVAWEQRWNACQTASAMRRSRQVGGLLAMFGHEKGVESSRAPHEELAVKRRMLMRNEYTMRKLPLIILPMRNDRQVPGQCDVVMSYLSLSSDDPANSAWPTFRTI